MVDEVAVLRMAVAKEQEHLWNDLYQGLRMAHNKYWSIYCESLINRIHWFYVVTGELTAWGDIQPALLKSGVYNQIRLKFGESPSQHDLADYESRQGIVKFPTEWINTLFEIQKMELSAP